MHPSITDMVVHVRASSAGRVTFVILADGALGDRIARLADDHAAYDRRRRRILHIPLAPRLKVVGNAAALILDGGGNVWGYLDEARATAEAWIEDAFLRASNATSTILFDAPAARSSTARGSGRA